MNQAVYRGYAQILIPNPREFDQLLGAINKHKPTMFPGVPTLYTAINNHPDVKAGKYDVRSIKVCISGAAGLPPEVQEEFQRITGGKLVEGYGLSEASPVTHANPIRSGTHTLEGLFIARGPGVRVGHALDADLMDIAPTVLHLMKSDLPSESDGKVLLELFEAEAEPHRREVSRKPLFPEDLQEKAYNADEMAQIEKQLRDLGYLG